MNFSHIIPAYGYLDISPSLWKARMLVIENAPSGNDLFWGVIPWPRRTLEIDARIFPEEGGIYALGVPNMLTSGSPLLKYNGDIPAWVRQGMQIEERAGIPADTYVKEVTNNIITMSANATANDDNFDLYFQGPPLTEINGITLAPGDKREFTTADHSRFLERGLRLYSPAGTTVKICQV